MRRWTTRVPLYPRQLDQDIKNHVSLQEEHSEGPWVEGNVVLNRDNLIDNVLGSLDNLVLFSDIAGGAFVNAVVISVLIWTNFLDASGNDTGLGIWSSDLQARRMGDLSLAGARLEFDTRRRHVGVRSCETRALLRGCHHDGMGVTSWSKVGSAALHIALA